MSAIADSIVNELVDQPKPDDVMRVSTDVQRGRDEQALKIRRDEIAQETDPVMRSRLQKELDVITSGRSQLMPNPPTSPQRSVFGSIADELVGGMQRSDAMARSAPVEAPDWWAKAKDIARQGTIEQTTPGQAVAEAGANALTGIGTMAAGAWRGLAALATGADLDEAVRQVHEPELIFGMRPRVADTQSAAGGALASAASAPGAALSWVGQKVGGGVMEATDNPIAATAAETVINAIPLAFMRGGKPAVTRAEPRTVGSGTIADVARGQPAIESPQPSVTVPKPVIRRYASVEGVPVEQAPPAAPQAAKAVMPAEIASAAESAAPKFAEEAPFTPGGVPKADQMERARILNAVGAKEFRKSAIEGDPAEARADFDLSNTTSDAGKAMKAKFEAERATLTKHAESIVADTDGSLGMDGSALYTRGDKILKPLTDLKDWFDTGIKKLYGEFDKVAPGVPVELKTAKAVLGDDSEFMGTTDGEALLRGVKSRMAKLEMTDEQGNLQATTAKTAEQLRQYVGDKWTPNTSRLIGRIKDALDDDVTSAAGADLAEKARALRAMRSQVFENDIKDPQGRTIPNGVGKIVDASRNKGIELNVPTEKVPDAVARLPVDQLSQFVQTLKNAPAELQPQAQAALAEVKGHFANKILEAGSTPQVQWGAKPVAQYVKDNAAKLRLLFDDAELEKIRNLNDAGHILRTDPYPGAAVQTHNLSKLITGKTLEYGGSIIGGVGSTIAGVGPIPGTVAGAAGGRAMAGKIETARDVRGVQKRFTTLGEISKGGK